MKPLQLQFSSAILTFLICSTFGVSTVAAPIRTCVQVSSTTNLPEKELKKLVDTELARFPSHQWKTDNCESKLYVETFPFSEKKYVTLRVKGEVPVRYAYSNTDELVHQIQKGLKLVLGNDPVYLKENISQYSETQRSLHGLKIKGSTLFRIELFESISRTGKGASYGPGFAVGFSKGSRNLSVFTRIHASISLPAHSEHPVWRPVGVGLDAGFNYEFNRTKPATGYLGAGLGLGFVRFEGEVDDRSQTVNELLVQCFARAGVRLFRLTDFDLDLFAMAYLPLYPTSDVDTTLLGKNGRAYTPHVQLGIGIGF